jgi:hypothetical protein
MSESLCFCGTPVLNVPSSDEEDGFSRALVDRLIETLESNPLPHLTPNEQAHLLVLIQTTLEVTLPYSL